MCVCLCAEGGGHFCDGIKGEGAGVRVQRPVTAMMMSSAEALAPRAIPGCRDALGFGRVVDFVCSEAEQLHYRR